MVGEKKKKSTLLGNTFADVREDFKAGLKARNTSTLKKGLLLSD